ncbi:MAG: tetratricopeptide repeat protein [Nannocystaceae bacterium]
MPALASVLLLALTLGPSYEPSPAPREGSEGSEAGAPSRGELADLRAQVAAASASDPGYADLLLRLAARLSDGSRRKEALADGLGAEASAEALRLAQEASSMRAEAAELYAALLRAPNFNALPRADEALFELAALRLASGDPEGMRALLLRLVRDFPRSPRIPGAYLVFGDHYFSAGDMAVAERFYAKVASFPQASERPYALFKLAWVRRNGGDAAGALEHLVRVLGDPATEANLRRVARRDVIGVYVEVGKPGRAAAFFRRISADPATGQHYEAEMLGGLRQAYLDAGRDADAAAIRDALAEAERRLSGR